MRFLRRLVLFGLLAWAFFYWQNCAIQTQQVTVRCETLPDAFDGLRIVEIADLHGREFGEGNARLLKEVAQAQPDLICIDGDLFGKSEDIPMLEPLLTGLCDIAPTFYVTGNHEWQVDGLQDILAQMEALGVTVLRNEYAIFKQDGAQFVIAGVNDPCGPYDQKTPAELVEEIRQEVGEDSFILMLAHRNDTITQWAQLGVDLVLTGHCHGGVVRLPFVGGVFGTDRELFPDYDAGLYREGNTQLYVSRGLGFSKVKLRLFNRPHLPVLVLES